MFGDRGNADLIMIKKTKSLINEEDGFLCFVWLRKWGFDGDIAMDGVIYKSDFWSHWLNYKMIGSWKLEFYISFFIRGVNIKQEDDWNCGFCLDFSFVIRGEREELVNIWTYRKANGSMGLIMWYIDSNGEEYMN